MKIKKSELQKIINEYLAEENNNLDYLISENIFRGPILAGFLTHIIPDATELAKKGPNWKNAIRSIVKKAGSPKKAMNNAYDILNSGLIKTVINLAKGGYRKKATGAAKGRGMTLKEYSKVYPPFDLKYIQKLIAYSKKTYPGILKNSVIIKFRPVLKKVLKGLNPHILADDAIDAIFYGKSYPAIAVPLPIEKDIETNRSPETTNLGREEEQPMQSPVSKPETDQSISKPETDQSISKPETDQSISKPEKSLENFYRIPGDKTWEYKKVNGKWHARKIGSKKLINISKDKKAVIKLDKTAKPVNEVCNKNTLLRLRY